MSNIHSRFRAMRNPLGWVLAVLLAMGPHSLWGAAWTGEAQGGPSAPSAQDRQVAVRALEQAGLNPEEARGRVEAMQEQEIAHIASGETEVRRGGDAVVTVLVVVLLVGLIFYVFDHVHCRA